MGRVVESELICWYSDLAQELVRTGISDEHLDELNKIIVSFYKLGYQNRQEVFVNSLAESMIRNLRDMTRDA